MILKNIKLPLLLLTGFLLNGYSIFGNTDTTHIEKLPAAVNSAQIEERPVLSPDGWTLYFYRRGNPNLNLWKSEWRNGQWQPAEHLSALETPYDESISALSADGRLMILYIKSPGAGWDFYEVSRTRNGWSSPRNMGRYINTASWEGHGCLSADGQVFLFCSQRGGLNDIYASFRKNGEWSIPVSLGVMINSSRMEYTPYLHLDGRTLYFSSEGHQPNYGTWDVYRATRVSKDSWTNWSQPENLGERLNGKGEDYGYVVDSAGDYAYFSRNGDIYRVGLREVKTEETPAMLKPELKETREVAATKTEAPLSPSWEETILRKKGVAIRLNNVLFEQSTAELLEGSFAELDRLAALLTAHPELRLEIAGHTDNVGSAPLNLKLSIDRAKAVKAYLTEKGIAAERMAAVGYGETRPAASNDTEDGRQWNRRVEVKVNE